MLNTQHAVFTAEDALVQATLSYLRALVSLYKALGGGWQR
jgi:outer membrane protein TolC